MRWLSAWLSYRPTPFIVLVSVFLPILSVGSGGMAAAQAVRLSTTRQNVLFPSTTVGVTSAAVTIPLQINSDGTTITAISAPASAGSRQEFSVQSIGCALSTPLAAETVCDVNVTFTPGSPGNRTAPLQVSTSSAGNFNFGMEGLGLGPQVALNSAIIGTVAGNGSETLSGEGGPAVQAGVPTPLATAIDSAGNLYIADPSDAVVRKVATDTGVISIIAGINGSPGFTGYGPAINAQLNGPASLAIDSAGNLYIADSANQFIRKVAVTTGAITTVVGIGAFVGRPPIPPVGYKGDGGPANTAWMNYPTGITFDNANDLYIADTGNNVVRRVDAVTDIITTVAGDNKAGYSGDGGPATGAELNSPNGVAVDDAGNLYIADSGNSVIRRVDAVTDVITTVAGNGTAGYSGDGGPATSAELHSPSTVSVDSAGNLYIVDTNNSRIREVFATSGIITTIVGTGTAAFAGDNSNAASAELNYPGGITLDSFGNLYIADSLNNRIRKVNVLDSQLNFGSTRIGFTSLDSPQTATIMNIGNAPLIFSVPVSGLNPSVSPNFGLSNSSTCPQLDISSSSETLASGSSCSLLLSFAPIQSGPISGTANIADNAMSIPPFVQTINLNAVGLPASGGASDFSLSVTPSSQTISSTMSSAAYMVTVTGIYGFSGNVTLSTAGLPPGVNATFNPASVAVTGTNASSTFTVTVSSVQARSTPNKNLFPGEASALRYGLLLLSFPLLGLAGRRKQMRSLGQKTFLMILVLATLGAATCMTSCANIGLVLQPQTYNITINGTSGNLQHSTAVSLTVEQYTKVKYH